MSKSSDDSAFLNFEKSVDHKYRSLSIIKGPFLFLLAQYHHTIHNLLMGSRINGIEADRAKALALMSNLSYVLPIMVESGTREFLNQNLDALAYFLSADPTVEQLNYATAYTNLFEVFPPYHRKRLRLLSSDENTFKLDYWSEEVRRSEYRDIILGEISIPVSDSNFPINPETLYKFIMYFPEKLDFGSVLVEQMKLFEHHYHNLFEPPLLDDDGMRALAGVTKEEFRRFSAFWHSWADFLIQAMVMVERMRNTKKYQHQDENLLSKIAEFCFFRLKENFYLGNLKAFTGLSDSQIDTLMCYYQINLDDENPEMSHCSDGYLPPFIKIQNQIIVAPHAIKTFLHSRNMVYAANKLDTQNFNNEVSAHLEPELISQAQELLSFLPGIEIAANIEYSTGELDIIAYSSSENLAIHFQAKGAIPPQGSRMTRSLEQRVTEALRQLNTFKELDKSEQDDILSRTFGRELKNVRIVDAVLCRTYFGSEKVYLKRDDALLVNLAMLAKACLISKHTLVLGRVIDTLKEMEDELLKLAKPRTEFALLEFDRIKIEFPLMKYNDRKLLRYNSKIWEKLLKRQPNILRNWWNLGDISKIGIFTRRP